jgi:hypothetical protein
MLFIEIAPASWCHPAWPKHLFCVCVLSVDRSFRRGTGSKRRQPFDGFPGLCGEGLYLRPGGGHSRLEHVRLQKGAPKLVLAPLVIPGGLKDKVQVYGLPARMGPQADVDLIGFQEGVDGRGDQLLQRAQFQTFCAGQLPHVQTMA